MVLRGVKPLQWLGQMGGKLCIGQGKVEIELDKVASSLDLDTSRYPQTKKSRRWSRMERRQALRFPFTCSLLTFHPACLRFCRPDGKKKAFVRLTPDQDALDVSNRIGFI